MANLGYVVTEAGYFLSHRLPVACAALQAGHKVFVLCHANYAEINHIKNLGFDHVPLRYMSRSGMGVYSQIKSCLELKEIYQRHKLDIVHHVAMKPVLLGSIASILVGVPRTINALAGLGYLFISKNPVVFFVRLTVLALFYFLFRSHGFTLILQNTDDYKFFKKFVPRHCLALIRGSGVDVSYFGKVASEKTTPVSMVLGARMLWDKGIGETIAACRLLRQRGLNISFVLVGKLDPQNPKHIKASQIQAWQEESLCTWMGHVDDLRPLFKKAHMAVLPSYREGLPKFLLDAGASALPLITTNVPGCREVVIHKKTGLLVPLKDEVALADAIETLMNFPALRLKLGQAAQAHIRKNFPEELVIKETLNLYASN